MYCQSCVKYKHYFTLKDTMLGQVRQFTRPSNMHSRYYYVAKSMIVCSLPAGFLDEDGASNVA